MTLEEVKLAAMQLNRAERQMLIDDLQETVLFDEDRKAIDEAAVAESDRRYKLYLADPSRARDAFEALDELEKKLKQ